MPEVSFFKGFVRDVRYRAFLDDTLTLYDIAGFDVNTARSFGLVGFPSGQIGYSKWVSPKRTRTYPLARLYNVFNAPMRMTVIPVLKDEGADGDNDRIQYSTISWMNLLNVYIVLGYYTTASKNQSAKYKDRAKLTAQKLDGAMVHEQMAQISQYKQSALHWNRSLFEDRFVELCELALKSYARISMRTGVRVHDRTGQRAFLDQVVAEYSRFRDISLRGSRGAVLREVRTSHGFEYLTDGEKAALDIENYLGGVYHLTVDEILREKGQYVIQESKNTTLGFLPSTADIKDGLFRLILYSNLDTLTVNDKAVAFTTRLKLTGKTVKGSIRFPCSEPALEKFTNDNASYMTRRNRLVLEKLYMEATNNQKLEIEIKGNA